MLEHRSQRTPQAGQIPDVCCSSFRQPGADLRVIQVKHEVVRSQARHIPIGVKTREGIIEIVRQEDLLEVRLPQHPFFPIGLGHGFLGRIAQPGAVRDADAVALKIQEHPADLDEPLVLDSVIELGHVVEDGAYALARLDRGGQRSLVHADRMG